MQPRARVDIVNFMARKHANREMVPVPAAAIAAVAAVASMEEKIRARAYEIWIRNGCQEGRDQEDWLQAEREVMQEKMGGAAAVA